jgi:hypothetical protein
MLCAIDPQRNALENRSQNPTSDTEDRELTAADLEMVAGAGRDDRGGALKRLAATPPALSTDGSTRAGERLERGVDFAHGEETGIAS